jgi:hypothetical protein
MMTLPGAVGKVLGGMPLSPVSAPAFLILTGLNG